MFSLQKSIDLVTHRGKVQSISFTPELYSFGAKKVTLCAPPPSVIGCGPTEREGTRGGGFSQQRAVF
jgi:hypothetical protein